MLTGEAPPIEPDELEAAFGPEEAEEIVWMRILRQLREAGDERWETFQRLLQERAEERKRGQVSIGTGEPLEKSLRLSANEERDSIIYHGLRRGDSRLQICWTLDRKGLPTLPKMRARHVHQWQQAWADAELRKSVQQLFSKVKRRYKAVKP